MWMRMGAQKQLCTETHPHGSVSQFHLKPSPTSQTISCEDPPTKSSRPCQRGGRQGKEGGRATIGKTCIRLFAIHEIFLGWLNKRFIQVPAHWKNNKTAPKAPQILHYKQSLKEKKSPSTPKQGDEGDNTVLLALDMSETLKNHWKTFLKNLKS